MNLTAIKTKYSSLPKTVRLFAQRALLLFTGWKILYDGFLQQRGIPDRQLTSLTADVSAWLISRVYLPAKAVAGVEKSYIYVSEKLVVAIADGCNALELFVTYAAFLVCLPTSFKRSLFFILGGIPLLFVLNIARCSAIAWLNINHPGFADFAHHYLFQLLMYACIFGLWVIYSRSVYGNNEGKQHT